MGKRGQVDVDANYLVPLPHYRGAPQIIPRILISTFP